MLGHVVAGVPCEGLAKADLKHTLHVCHASVLATYPWVV